MISELISLTLHDTGNSDLALRKLSTDLYYFATSS